MTIDTTGIDTTAREPAVQSVAGGTGTAPQDDVLVRIDKLWTIFGQGAEAFTVHQDLDLDVRRGEILTLVGGSGTGKTVLLRHILGLTRPSRGSVTINGVAAADLPSAGASARMGMLFQHGALFSAFNVIDNIAFPLREQDSLPDAVVRDAAMVKLQMVGLQPEHALRMPSDLSGGMIKRVALARALIMDPPLLLLDEPTAGLDPRGSDEFCELLLDMHRELGLTVVMVTHDLDTLYALSTRVAVLAEKRVIVVGTPDEVVHFKHPFIEQFFLGERGLRALEPLQAPAAATAAQAPHPARSC
ncbi:ATP-binding cassette domain-containing protein [Corticibacter populi]|uniref:ATP-binding cassette domain-containing protein n=1 Tax=Corticibacter populi TaxID=1550736 RepID=A0A3M6QXN9_9BURK|nr:ATP-binding cassette domain-containing protein [Corticibacter populi]RMX07778.1 ATP-binding cassette domain-containing protein [Corticibacter populi]RZS35001.1 phospholipid/cholesterol/gamma-HCH transport system ATP-binding protein [Corticibacter populi]